MKLNGSLYVGTSWLISFVNGLIQLIIIYKLRESEFVELTVLIGFLSFLSFFDFGLSAKSMHVTDLNTFRYYIVLRTLLLLCVYAVGIVLVTPNLPFVGSLILLNVAFFMSVSILAKNFLIGNQSLRQAAYFHLCSEQSIIVMKIFVLFGMSYMSSLIYSFYLSLLFLLPVAKYLKYFKDVEWKGFFTRALSTVRATLGYFLPLGAWTIFLFELRSILPNLFDASDAYYPLLSLSVIMVVSGLITPVVNLYIVSANQKSQFYFSRRDLVLILSTILTALILVSITNIARLAGDSLLNGINLDTLSGNIYYTASIFVLSVLNTFACFEHKKSSSNYHGAIYFCLTLVKASLIAYFASFGILNLGEVFFVTILIQAVSMIVLYFGFFSVACLTYASIATLNYATFIQ